MSIRREESALAPSLAARHPGATATEIGAPAVESQTIGDRLGIERPPTPPKWPEPFAPQYKEVPEVSSSVVEDAFDGYDADPTGLFGKKKAAAGAKVEPKKGSMIANLKAAKGKADNAVRNAVAGGKAVAAGAKSAAVSAVDKAAGMQKFDYTVMSTDDFTGVLAVAKKANAGTDLDAKNNIKAFKKYKHGKVTKQAEAQEKMMLHKEALVKKIKGKEDKVAARAAPGRNAAVLGYSQVSESDESNEMFADHIFDPEAPAGAGVPTVVQMSEYDTNKVEGMMPISGLVVEPLDTDTLTYDGDTMTVTMQAVPEAKITEEVVNKLTKDQVEFEYTLCVHGLYVGEDKQLMVGQKILVHQKKPSDITAYGIATENGIESALYHAMEGKVIDLLYLWTCFRLVQGVHSLAAASPDKAQKAALKELLGASLGMATQYSFAEDVEDDDFDELNDLPLVMGN